MKNSCSLSSFTSTLGEVCEEEGSVQPPHQSDLQSKPNVLAQPALYPVQVRRLLEVFSGYGDIFTFTFGKAPATPMMPVGFAKAI